LSCTHFRKRIEEYQDGELEAGQAAAMEAHLRGCAACRRELALLKSEVRVYEAYADEVESALDPSPEICERAVERASSQSLPALPEGRRAGRTWGWQALLPVSPWVRQALAAVILVAVSVTATLLLVNRHPPNQNALPPQAAIGSSGEDSLDAALRSIQRAEQEYLDAIRVLSAIVEKEKATINPVLLAEFQRNLKSIDEHIAAARGAYYAHPSDPELAFYMLAAYSRKVEMLQDLAS
jgi:hypothetical protein